jgi:exonuclease V gamma subunit
LIANASMPVGLPGRLAANALTVEVEAVARVGHARCAGDRLNDVSFELQLEDATDLGGCLIVGRLDKLWPGGRIELGFSKVGRRSDFDLWVRHLVLCALVDRGAELTPRSVYVGRPASKSSDERVVVFDRISDPLPQLTRLFEWVWSTEDAPLPFFPKASWAFASKFSEGKTDLARRAAHQIFDGGDSQNVGLPESEEELEYARIWEGWSPLDSSAALPVRYHFEDIADRFFRPLIEAREVHCE